MSEMERMRLALAEALGEDPDAIQASNPRWLALMREGVLVSLHIGRWRAKTRLSWHDLGIELEEEADRELQKIVDLGHKKLLPASLLKELDAIESAARKWLEKKAVRTYWGFFVPVTAYVEWKEINEEHRSRYFAVRDRIVRDYQALVAEVVAGYRVAAQGAYRRLKALHPEALERFPNVDAFVEAFVQGIQVHIPPAEVIRDSFYFETELRYVPLPSLMAEEWAERERIEAQAAAERERLELQLQVEREWAWAEREKLRAEVQAARSAAEWKERLMREMHRDVVEQARRQKEELVDGFLRDLVVQLRSLVYEATTDVLAAIKRNDRLPPRSVVQLRNLVEQVRSLNFYGDQEIEAMINRVAFQVDGVQDRNLAEIQSSLRDIATVVRASLIGLGEKPRGARSLGVADEPTPEMVRRARRGLGLEDEEGAIVELPFPSFRQARLAEATIA